MKAPAAQEKSAVPQVSGQGFWRFAPVANAMPVPAEAQSFVKGAHGTLIIFVHPKNSNGVLIELMETPKGDH